MRFYPSSLPSPTTNPINQSINQLTPSSQSQPDNSTASPYNTIQTATQQTQPPHNASPRSQPHTPLSPTPKNAAPTTEPTTSTANPTPPATPPPPPQQQAHHTPTTEEATSVPAQHQASRSVAAPFAALQNPSTSMAAMVIRRGLRHLVPAAAGHPLPQTQRITRILLLGPNMTSSIQARRISIRRRI